MQFDVSAVRAAFPALSAGTAYFDGPGGSQTPQVVAQAMYDALMSPISNRGTRPRCCSPSPGARRRTPTASSPSAA